MFDPERYQPKISVPVSNGIIQQKTNHTNNNICKTKSKNNSHQQHVEDDESGMCSPPLWSTKNTHNKSNNYKSLSPESKTQAIERGQKELMEMVKNMPESCYELTLKDLVEHHSPKVVEEKKNLGNKNTRKREGISTSNSNNGRKIDKRNIGNFDSGGFYLKMVFPISLGSKKHNKKKELLVNNNSASSKVSPRTSVSDGFVNNNKEWWKKKSVLECEGVESNSGGGNSMKRVGSSSTSSCSSRSNSRYDLTI